MICYKSAYVANEGGRGDVTNDAYVSFLNAESES